MIQVLQPGLLTTIQDLGRRGFEQYGVPRSGAFDPFLASIANKLTANRLDQAVLEFALTGPTLQFQKDAVIAITGFGVEYDIDGEAIPAFHSIPVKSGSVLRFLKLKGWFGYISFSGGIDSERVLGSASTHVAGGIGKRLQKNQRIKIGSGSSERFALREPYWNFPEEPLLYLLSSQHTTRFNVREKQKITENSYKINAQSNRMGIRLDGPILDTPILQRSTPAIPGSVQIPQSGSPIILGPEGPTTGGYAQVAVITRTSWTSLAVSRPGADVRFEWTDRETACNMWHYREKLLSSQEPWQRF
jgi:antagonist of KipI